MLLKTSFLSTSYELIFSLPMGTCEMRWTKLAFLIFDFYLSFQWVVYFRLYWILSRCAWTPISFLPIAKNSIFSLFFRAAWTFILSNALGLMGNLSKKNYMCGRIIPLYVYSKIFLASREFPSVGFYWVTSLVNCHFCYEALAFDWHIFPCGNSRLH